jgi:hypothetical protein
MTAFIRSNRSFALVALIVCVCAATAPARTREIGGGQVYSSPKHAFTLVVPKATDFFNLNYSVREETRDGQYEFATFTIHDFGELYKAGVFQSGDVASTADRVAISTDFQKKTPPEIASETKVSTQFGDGVLRLYRLKGGALIAPIKEGNVTMTRAGNPRTSKTPPDSYVAVVIVQQGARIIFATAEDDNFGIVEEHEVEGWQRHVQDAAQKLLASMKLEK